MILGVGLSVSTALVGQPQKAALAAADSFGPVEQAVMIGAAAFQHLNNASGYEIDWSSDGYLTYTDETFLGVFVAPLSLPSGAEIVAICTYFYDTAPIGKVTTHLEAVKMANEFNPQAVVPVFGPFESDIQSGYGYACEGGSYTFLNWQDVDGDGNNEELVHRLRVDMTENDEGRLAFGGVKVLWHLQVSPPPEVQTFGDVPPDDGAYPFVEALVRSGITVGCSEGNFCPDAALTRRQMAVFLAKALGLHWAD
jgi:hypothetical protein